MTRRIAFPGGTLKILFTSPIITFTFPHTSLMNRWDFLAQRLDLRDGIPSDKGLNIKQAQRSGISHFLNIPLPRTRKANTYAFKSIRFGISALCKGDPSFREVGFAHRKLTHLDMLKLDLYPSEVGSTLSVTMFVEECNRLEGSKRRSTFLPFTSLRP